MAKTFNQFGDPVDQVELYEFGDSIESPAKPVDPLDLTSYTKDIPGDDGGAYYREKAEREAAEEAQRKELQKTVEQPTFLEEAHLAFDQGSNLVSDMNAVLTAALPSSTVSITFEGDNLLPTLSMGLGEDFEKLTYGS